jgi:predicted HNH restriction endonuclease
MTYVVRNRQWTAGDFDRLEQTLSLLRPSAAKLWQDEIKENPQKIKDWAFGFVRPGVSVQAEPVVKRNPDWSRDELILAFRLYMRHRPTVPAKSGVEVARLSRLLRHMAQRSTRSSSYRNTDGVYMKLMNFRSIDPEYTTKEKVVLKNNGKDELRVWALYANNLPALEAAADAIEAAIDAPASETGIDDEDEDDIEECEEGRILTRLHRYRERNRKLVALFKERAKKAKGRLECAGCDFDFAVKYGVMAERLVDVHHTRPVHTMKPGDKTDPKDLALLCVSCHRAVHSERQWLSVDELRRRLNKPQAI